MDFPWPGRPADNAYIRAFNKRFRVEYLSDDWFMWLEDRAEKSEAWRRDYNEARPHSGISNKVPDALMKLPDVSSPSVSSKRGKSDPDLGRFGDHSTSTLTSLRITDATAAISIVFRYFLRPMRAVSCCADARYCPGEMR